MIAGKVHLEAAAWAAVSIVAWAISAHFNVSDTIAAFAERHAAWQLDEFFTLIFFLAVGAFVTTVCQSRRHFRIRKAAEADAFTAARRDVLTGLPNRRMFLELAGLTLGEAWASGSKCSVLFIDLDGFKPVNDTLGHAVGDALLIAVGKRLERIVPTSSLVARLGGDEFTILLPHTTGFGSDPLPVAKEVLASLQKPFGISGHEVSINASIGIARGPDCGKRVEDLTDAADKAMYQAKRAGRGTICTYEPPASEERGYLSETGALQRSAAASFSH